MAAVLLLVSNLVLQVRRGAILHEGTGQERERQVSRYVCGSGGQDRQDRHAPKESSWAVGRAHHEVVKVVVEAVQHPEPAGAG